MKTSIHFSYKCLNLIRGPKIRVRALFIILITSLMWIEEVKSQNYTVNYSVIGLYPQSMVYYPARKKFIVSSTNQGQLGYIDDNAKYKLILKDPLLTGATRMLVKDNSLYVLTCSTASSETSKFNQPHLVKLNLKNNRIISNTRIGKSHIAGFKTSTDLAVDDIGSIYIIDDLAAVIHRVKSDGSSSILLENKLLSKVKSVIYHKNGYLLVAIDNDLYKINLADNNFSKVFLEEGFNEINSLHFSPNHLLILAEGGDVNKVHILNSSNSWASANLLRTDTTTYINPNSIEYVDNKIFVLDSHIKNSSDKAVKSGDFSVHVTDLKKRMKVKGRKGTVTVGELE